LNFLYRTIHSIAVFLSDFGSLVMMAVTLLIVANVLYRTFGAISSVYEVVELSMSVVAVFTMIMAEVGNMHIVVDAAMGFFPKRLKEIFQKTGTIMSIVYYGIMGCAALSIVPEKFALDEMTDITRIPITPFRAIWGGGLIIFCILLLVKINKRTDEQEDAQ